LFVTCKNIGVNYNKACYSTQSILGAWKHTSSILAGRFICHQHGSNSYVASYAPLSTALMTNKKPAQLLDAYLFPGALMSHLLAAGVLLVFFMKIVLTE
jgi:hypothetical protein